MPIRQSPIDTDIQKRTFPIPPIKIDKTLIQELGEFLENLDLNLVLTYSSDSKTKETTRQNVEDFVDADWGEGLRRITINSKSMVRIRIDLDEPRRSRYTIYGKNITNVTGIASCIKDIFQKHRLGYASVKTSWSAKLAIPTVLTLVFAYLTFTVIRFINPADFYNAIIGTVLVAMFGGTALYFFVQWLFPYFEYGEPSQKSVRKYIWFVLFGLGIVPAIILKLLGL